MAALPHRNGYRGRMPNHDSPTMDGGPPKRVSTEQATIARMKVLAAEGASLTAIAQDLRHKGHKVSPAAVERLLAQ